MAHYLFQASYTPESWAGLIKNPENRRLAIAKLMESAAESWSRSTSRSAPPTPTSSLTCPTTSRLAGGSGRRSKRRSTSPHDDAPDDLGRG